MHTRLAITVLGVLAGLALVCATYLTAAGNDATVVWPLATLPIGAIAGILAPTQDA